MRNKSAFTMLELIFVIVIMGFLAAIGSEILSKAYKNFISSKIQNTYQNQSASAIEFIASRLQYRIKNSVIVRDTTTFTNFELLEGKDNLTYDVLEWVGYDMYGFRDGAWSGIYSKNLSSTELYSPESNTTAINTRIDNLSYTNASISDAAIYFIGSNSDKDSWGWDGNGGVQFADLNNSMKPIKAGTALNKFAANVTSGDDFSSIDIKSSKYNSYQLAWSAYAIVFDKVAQKLWLYYNYQPWEGDKYTDYPNKNIQKVLIMDEVSDFKKRQRKGVMSIKVCSISEKLKDFDDGNFLTCKEKTIL